HVEKVMTEAELDDLLESMPPDVSMVTQFWRRFTLKVESEELRNALVIAAEREPPMPWANHVLATEAVQKHELAEAGVRFEKEGLAFPERSKDLDASLQ